jgi:hypothetical protein
MAEVTPAWRATAATVVAAMPCDENSKVAVSSSFSRESWSDATGRPRVGVGRLMQFTLINGLINYKAACKRELLLMLNRFLKKYL